MQSNTLKNMMSVLSSNSGLPLPQKDGNQEALKDIKFSQTLITPASQHGPFMYGRKLPLATKVASKMKRPDS